MSFIFDVATANIKNSLSQSDVQSDVDKVVAIADIIGFQEIRNAVTHRSVVDAIPGWSKHAVNATEDGRYVPIAWKDSVWSLVDSGGFEIFAGDATYNLPPRWANWVVLERAASAGGPQKIRVVNTHFTSGMEYDQPVTPARQAARDGWDECWANMNAQIDSWIVGGYTPMVLTGDYNEKVPSFPKFSSAQEFDTAGGIDHISHIPGSKFDPVKDVTDLNGDVTNDRFNTDHGPDIWRLKFL